MADKDGSKSRQRMVVEEVAPVAEATFDPKPIEEIKEKVEELQDLTEHMSDDVKESAEVQEEIVETTEKIEAPVAPLPIAPPAMEPIYPRRSNGVNPLVIILPGILLLGALLGGIVFYQSSVDTQRNTTDEITPTPIEESTTSTTPSATPAAKLDLTKFTVVILNGSGISGEAGKAKDLVTAAGFKVGTTGNASTYDFTKTVVKAKDTVDADFIAKLVETLGKNYVVDKTGTLTSTSKNDVEVTVGTSKAE